MAWNQAVRGMHKNLFSKLLVHSTEEGYWLISWHDCTLIAMLMSDFRQWLGNLILYNLQCYLLNDLQILQTYIFSKAVTVTNTRRWLLRTFHSNPWLVMWPDTVKLSSHVWLLPVSVAYFQKEWDSWHVTQDLPYNGFDESNSNLFYMALCSLKQTNIHHPRRVNDSFLDK